MLILNLMTLQSGCELIKTPMKFYYFVLHTIFLFLFIHRRHVDFKMKSISSQYTNTGIPHGISQPSLYMIKAYKSLPVSIL